MQKHSGLLQHLHQKYLEKDALARDWKQPEMWTAEDVDMQSCPAHQYPVAVFFDKLAQGAAQDVARSCTGGGSVRERSISSRATRSGGTSDQTGWRTGNVQRTGPDAVMTALGVPAVPGVDGLLHLQQPGLPVSGKVQVLGPHLATADKIQESIGGKIVGTEVVNNFNNMQVGTNYQLYHEETEKLLRGCKRHFTKAFVSGRAPDVPAVPAKRSSSARATQASG